MKTIENISKLISENFETGKINNSDLVKIIELCGAYLNLKSITQYAKDNNMSYNGVMKRAKSKNNDVKIVSLFGCKFVLDNN